MTLPNVGVVCFLASYLLAWGADLARARRPWPGLRWIAVGSTLAGFIAHTLYLLLRSQQTHLPPLLSSEHDWLIVLTWLTMLLLICLTWADAELGISLIVLPVVLVVVVAALFVGQEPGLLASVQRGWIMLHVSVLVLGIAAILLSFLLSLIYLWQHRRLKSRQFPASGMTLPSLESLTRWNRWSLIVAVPLLTLGLASGVGLSTQVTTLHRAQKLTDPLVIGSGAGWLVLCGVVFWMARSPRHAGRQVAWLSLCASGLLLLTILGVQVLTATTRMTSLHHRPSANSGSGTPQQFPKDLPREPASETTPSETTEVPR